MSIAVADGRFFPVTGVCMKRTIPEGALVRIEPASPAGLLPGDVVLMEGEGGFYLHRFLLRIGDAEAGAFLTKGDEAARPDPLAEPDALIGRLAEISLEDRSIAFRPRMRERVQALTSGWFWLAFMLLKAVRRGVALLS